MAPEACFMARLRCLVLGALVILVGGCTGTGDLAPSPSSGVAPTTLQTRARTSQPAGGGTSGWRSNGRVTRVIDGDTIDVLFRGRNLDVRLIGVDTPETVAPSQPVECYGKAASDFTTRRLDRQPVRLEFDVERLDRYGRTLAYVWQGERMFNEILLRRGFAQVATFPPNVRYVDRFLVAERAAREAGR